MADSTDILQEFLVSLGFNVDKASLKTFQEGVGTAAQMAVSAGKAVIGLAVAADAMVTAVSGQMEKLYFVSQRTGESVGNIEALEKGFKQVGLGAGAATEAIERMAQVTRMNPGLKALADGLIGKDSNALGPAEALVEIVEKLSKMPHIQGAAYAQLFGIDERTFQTLVKQLPELRAAEQRLRDMQKNAGVDPDAAAKASHEYQTMWRDIVDKADLVTKKWTIDLLPAAKLFAHYIDVALDALAKWTPSKALKSYIGKFNALNGGDGPGLPEGDGPAPKPAGLPDGGDGPAPKPAGRREASGKTRGIGNPPTRADDLKAAPTLFNNLEHKYNLPPGLLDKVWSKESGRGDHMLSPKGAQGHFGFMPNTAKEYGLKDPNNLAESANAAARKFRHLLDYYKGDLGKAAGAYNWGEGNVDKFGLNRAPFETRDYVASIAGGKAAQSVVVAPKTEINVNGAGQPREVASEVARLQEQILADAVRNLGTRIQ